MKSRVAICKSLRTALAAGLLISVTSLVDLRAQVAKPSTSSSSKVEPAPPTDPLGRETPRSAVMGLLTAVSREDYATASRYLQIPDDRSANIEQLIKQFSALRPYYNGDIALLSDDPNGTLERGLPPGEVRAGSFHVGRTTADLILIRVEDPAVGKIWLVSKESVAMAAKLSQAVKREPPAGLARIMPAALANSHVFGMSLGEWLAWFLSLPISLLLAWPVGHLLSVPALLTSKLRKTPFTSVWNTSIGRPLRYILAIAINGVSIYLLHPPLLYRVYYMRLMAALLAVCLIWLLAKIIDRGFERALGRARVQQSGTESILLLAQRFLRIVLVIIAFLSALSLLGYNTRTALAGIGIGGLAIALGAQKTLENFLGGVSLLIDKAVHVGNFCKIGDQLGSIEDIGLRSVKVRTLDQTVLVIPNGALAQMRFENFATRRKCLLNQHFSLRIETKVEELRLVLDRVQKMFDQHPGVEPGSSRIVVADFAGAAYELELWAYGKTSDWTEFTRIRQDVILKIAEIVADSGAQFAAPTQLTYFSRDAGLETPDDSARGVAEIGVPISLAIRAESGSRADDKAKANYTG